MRASVHAGRCRRSKIRWRAGLTLPVVGAAFFAVSATSVRAQLCPGDGDCCTANGSPGCNDFNCCDWVCFLDEACCSDVWDEACAGFALAACPDLCGSGCPGTGDCCTSNGTPGCSDATCCEVVCLLDPTCCSGTWDASCAALARQSCSACVPPPVCPGDGDCCAANGSPGCDDAACCEAVCTLDPSCCDTEWTDDCAVTANLLCGRAGAEYCGFCPGTDPCCEIHDTPGCNRQSCCDIVCGLDSTCCTDRWSLSCRAKANDNCAASVCACAFPGDFDDDGAVSLTDVAEFMNCYTGASGTVGDLCACADFNGDGSADGKDTRPLSISLTGP